MSAPVLGTLLAWADPEESVESAREALDPWFGGYPWYDAQTDGLRRVELREPMDWSWLWDWFPDWGSGSSGWSSVFPDSLLGWIAWTVLILMLAAAVYYLLRAYRQQRAGAERSGDAERGAAQDDEIERIEALPFPVARQRGSLLEEARRLYNEGSYSQAILYLFSFQLVELDRQHLIRLAKGKTNRQYLRQIGARPRLRQMLDETMVAFEDVFFGNHAIDRRRFESCWTRIEEFQSLAAETT